jgi:uncharacterized protein YjbI with pentapeptide repeats/WD40 repeat protein/cellulose biosynthesis protein BcsQ
VGYIATFYSYKGGVGRTMALANVAVLLSKWGYSCLAVDWDLEAPGLETFFQSFVDVSAVSRQLGIIDLLLGINGGRSALQETPNWFDMLVSVKIPGSKRPLDLLTAGRRDSEYFGKVRSFDLGSFYTEQQGGDLIETLRNEWTGAYDFVLVDSRTGVTDIGGICTIHLPDVLMLLFTATEQSLTGVIDVATRAFRGRQRLPVDRLGLISVPVPSRFESTEEFKISQEWLDRFAKDLSATYDDWLPKSVSKRDFIALTKLPYSPYFSFGEKLAVLEQGTVDPAGLGHAYETLAAVIASRFENIQLLLESRDEYVRRASRREYAKPETSSAPPPVASLNPEAIDLHHRWLSSGGLEGKRLELRNGRLSRAVLRADLRCADLSAADFLGADLRETNFSEAELIGAEFVGADLSGANLTAANLTGANLTRSNLASVVLQSTKLRDAQMQGADLRGADLSGADLSNADLSYAKLIGANLTGANLNRCNIHEADFSDCMLTGASLFGVDLCSAKMTGANLSRVRLPLGKMDRIDLSRADLSLANLSKASLVGATLVHTNLHHANLSGANLSAADLTFARLYETDLSGAVLDTTALAGATLKGAIGLEESQLKSAVGDSDTASFLRWRKSLETRRKKWQQSRRRKFLLKGWALRAGEYWLSNSKEFLTGDEVNFVTLSRFHRRKVLRRRWILLPALVITILASPASWWWLNQRPVSRSRKLAASSLRIQPADAKLSLKQAVEALSIMETPEAVAALRAALRNTIWGESAVTSSAVLRNRGWVLQAHFSPASNRAVTASFDGFSRLWASDGRYLDYFGYSSRAYFVRYSQQGESVIVGFNNGFAVYRASDTGRFWGVDLSEAALDGVYSADGTLLVVRTISGATAYDGRSKSAVLKYNLSLNGAKLDGLGFSDDSMKIVTCGPDGVVRVWKAQDGQLLHECKGHTSEVYTATFAPGSTRVISAGADRTARIWDVADWSSITLEGHTGDVYAAEFSPDGNLVLTASGDGTARIWNASTGRQICVLQGDGPPILAAHFSLDGRFAVTAGDDKVGRVWDVATGVLIAKLQGHSDGILSAEFSPDGKLIITASKDNTARLFACEVCGTTEEVRQLAKDKLQF